MGHLADQYLEYKSIEARDAFKNHVITKKSEGRWYLQVPEPDTRYPQFTVNSLAMAVEIVSLEHGCLYVGGDIDPVIYSHSSSAPDNKPFWLGKLPCNSYVVEKARYVFNNDCWDLTFAIEDLEDFLVDFDSETVSHFRDIFNPNVETQADFLNNVDGAFMEIGLNVEFEDIAWLGGKVPLSVIYTHAALAHLCNLIETEEVLTSAAEQEQAEILAYRRAHRERSRQDLEKLMPKLGVINPLDERQESQLAAFSKGRQSEIVAVPSALDTETGTGDNR